MHVEHGDREAGKKGNRENRASQGGIFANEIKEVIAFWSARLWKGRGLSHWSNDVPIRARLSEGWTVADLLAVVEGAARSPHNREAHRRTANAVFSERAVPALAALGRPHLDMDEHRERREAFAELRAELRAERERDAARPARLSAAELAEITNPFLKGTNQK